MLLSVGDLLFGNRKELIVQQGHGEYYEASRQGRLYMASSASAGIALIVPATTGGHPTLWNPLGSGYNLSVVSLDLGYVSGNNAPTTIEWARTKNAGAAAATGSPILTATKVDVENCLVGAPADDTTIWSPTVNTFTAAPTFLGNTGLSLFTGVAATAVAPFPLHKEYHGALVLMPGTAISLCTQAATTTALFQVTIVYERVPLGAA